MNWLTRVFLVLLRLAIGWHFFFEGVNKLPQDAWPVKLLNSRHPATARELTGKPTFSSENYLRESAGPFGSHFRDMAGDSVIEHEDRRASGGRRPRPHPGEPPSTTRAGTRLGPLFPPLCAALPADRRAAAVPYHLDRSHPQTAFPAGLPWQGLYECGVGSPDLPNQLRLAETKFNQLKYQTALWLMQGTKVVKHEGPNSPTVETERSNQDRIKDYQKQLARVRELQDKQMALLARDVNARLAEAKGKANRMRAELRNDLEQQTLAMKKALHTLLTEEQKREPLPQVVGARTATDLVTPKEPLEPQYDSTTWAKRPAVPGRPDPTRICAA